MFFLKFFESTFAGISKNKCCFLSLCVCVGELSFFVFVFFLNIQKYSVFDEDGYGKNDFMGEVECNLNDLREKKDLKLGKNGKNKNYGFLKIRHFTSFKIHSFLDYLKAGCEISLMVAIDFTGSNGDPRDQGTLHDIYSQPMSPYQQAIHSIGNVLSHYDSDNKYPVYGFVKCLPFFLSLFFVSFFGSVLFSVHV